MIMICTIKSFSSMKWIKKLVMVAIEANIPSVYSKILELQLLKDNLAKNAAPANATATAQPQGNKVD